jgi:hypothetical protein
MGWEWQRLRGRSEASGAAAADPIHCPNISVESSEEDRFAVLLRCVAADIGVPLHVWSVTEGLSHAGGRALDCGGRRRVSPGAALGQVARNLIGLPEAALQIFRKCLRNRGKADAVVLDDVLEAKRTALKTDGLLETVRRDAEKYRGLPEN